MDYKLWEDAGFGINGQQQPVQKNRGFFDALSDFASGTWANTSSMMDSTDLNKLREELLHPVAGTTPEEYEALKQQYRDLYNEQQQTRLAGQQAQNRLKQDGRIGEFAAYATNVGGSLPSIGLNLVGHATGSFPITNVLGSYMDAESAAIEASEKVLSEGGTLEQAEIAFKNALPKQIATTIPDTVVDQMIWGGMGKKLGLGKGAIDSAKRFASQLKDPATRIGSEVAFKTGKRFLGRGAGLVADSLMNIGSENIQEGSQNYVSDIEAARAMGQDVDYSLGGFKDSLLSKEGIETAKGTTAATLLTSLIGGSIKSGQYLSRGAETNVGIKTHNAFSGMQNEKGIKLDPQARAEQEMTLSMLRGFSLEELSSWSDADILAESAVAVGDMRKNITGEGSDISQIREAADTLIRLTKDKNSITKEGQITEETRDLLTRMGFDEKDINDWFTSPTDVLAKARQMEQEEQAKQKQAEQEGEKPKTTIKVSPETGETLNVKQGEVVQGQKPTEQTTDTQEPITEKTTQNGLGEQAKQAEQQGTIQQDEEIEYPDSIIGWERDHDADNRDGVEYEGATYYSLKDNSISARIEPSGNGFTVIKVDEQGNATSDSKNKNFPSLKAAIDYLQQNKGETVFQKSDETQAEMPSDGVDATKGNSGTLVGSVEDLYNLSQKEPDLLNPYEFAEFVRIKQHMGAGDLDVYIDKEHTGQFLGEDGQWHRVNAKADRPETAKGRAIIQLYKGGDLGSAIHEIAHTAYWKLSDADKRTFGYYAIKTQGKYIADSLDEDYTPDFENRLLKLASKVSQNVELDEQDKQLQEKILNKAATNQIYDNLITFYNSKMNGGAVDLKNLTPQQQRAIEERWAWEMSQWYVEGYSVGVAPSNIIQRIAQRGCESIAKDLNSLARIWQHIHHKDNNEIENIYRGGQAEQQQEQAEQTPNINVQFTNELERQAMPNVNMPMNFGGEQTIQYGIPTLGESYNNAQEYANLYNELERRDANRQKMQGLPSADGSIPTVQNRPTQTEEKKTTTGYKEAIPTTKANKEEEKLVDIIKNRKSGWEKALERLAEINPKTFRNILYSEAATQGEQVNGQGLTNQNESGIVEQKKEVADNGETENTRGTEDLQGNVGEVQGRGTVRTGNDNRTGEGRIQQETVEGSSEGNGKDIPLLKNTKFKSVYNKRKEKKTEIKDWRDLSDSDQTKQVYVDALNASKEANEDYGVYVSEQTVESLKDCKVVLHKNKMAGFAITPDGNIVGVFSNPKNPIRGVLNDMIFIARMMGGNSMDCFGDFLLYGYRACGFTPVARTSFDETYYPASDPKNATIRKESPDVFFLVKDNDNNTTYLDKMNKGEYKNDKVEADSIYHIEGKDSYDQALGFQGQVLEETNKKENKGKSTKEIADLLRPKEETVTDTQETTEQTKEEQTETKEETKVEKPTIPTDEIYSHLYFGDKTGKLKYNPETKKIEYFETEYGAPELVYNAELNDYVKKRSHKLVKKGEITPEQYNELKQKYEQDFRKVKGEKKENIPDLVEGMKKEDFMYSTYKETKLTEKEKEDTTKELGKENQGLVTGKSEEYARQNAAEESFNKAMKGESLSGMEETELTKEQKKEAESSVEQELPKVEKKKTEKQTNTKETKKTTSKPKTTDFLSALHKKYKSVTGTPIGEKGYRFKDDEKAFIEGFKGMIDGAVGNKEELVNVAKRLDSWFQNDPTERNRMVRKYLSQYLADAAKINAKQDTNTRHSDNTRFQAVAVKDTKALESKYEQDFLKVGKQMGYTENEINHAFILYATGNTNINIDTSKENNKAERIFVRINNKINNDLWKSGQNVQRGLDGKWRTYIDDRNAKLKSGILKLLNEPNKIKGKTFYLGQIMSHLDLYKYNKKLKGVKVSFKDFGSKSNKLGQVTENGTIELNYRKMKTERDLMSTLLHEIQHTIQKIEGFARGGNGEEFLDPRNQTLFSALTKNILNDVEKIVKFAQDNEYPLTQKQADKILNMDEFEFEKYLNENSTIGVILNDYIELKNKKLDLYKNLLGEIEARDASLRYGLDDEHYNKIKPLDLDYQYRKLKENRNNVSVRFQKSDENKEKKLTKKQEKKLEIQKEIKEAKEKGQTTDTYKDVYSVSFTKSAQESKVNQEKMKYFDARKSAWERHEENGRVTYTRTTPFEHHQKVITYNGINDKVVEQKPKKKYREWMDFIKEKISKNLFNDQYALYKLATDLGLGNAYMRMVVTQGYAQKTGVALEKGIMYNGKRTRAMNDIAREIGEEKQSAFCEYAIAKHLHDIYNRPNNKIEQKYDKDEVDAVIKRVEASQDYKLFERCRKDLVEYNHACFHVLVDGGIITEQEFQRYVERDKNYVPLSKVMDKEDFGFNSIQFARSMVNVGSPVRKLGTSKREIKNIFGEMQRRTAIYYAAAARNKAGQIFINEICNTLDKMYDGDTVSRGASIIRKVKVKEEDGKLITRPDTDKQIFYVNNGGKHEFYQVSDPEIYRALRHLDEEQLHIINGMLEKMLSAPAGLVRATATATPDFGIRNIIRDNLTAFYTSEHGFIPIIDALWGMREIKRNGEFYQKYIDQVGEYGLKGRGELLKNNTYKLKDYRESLKDEILKEFNILTDSKRSLKDRTKALLRMTIGAPFFAFGEQLEKFNMYLEQGTRVGEFKNAKMGYNGLIDRITSDLSVDINNARQSDIIAAYKAQDVTLYFSQHGLLGGKFNRFVPFLNASLLGAQKFVNAVDLAVTGKDSMNQKNTRLRKELLFKVALSTAFAIGLSAAGHGDEDYDEAPDYEKDTFWIFPNGIRIPKDEVFGRSIGTAVQRAFDQYYKEGKVDALKTFESIAGMFKPNTVLPTVLDMFYGSIYNKDSFTGREIVPEYMTHKVGYQQKDIYTGNLAADLTEVLYKAFGINLSAKRVDWALQKNLTNAKKYLDAVYDVKEKLTDPEHFNEKMARGYDKNDSTGSFVGGLRDNVPPVLNLVTGTFATNRSQYQSVSDFQKKYQEIKRIADNDSDIPMTREQKRKWQRYEKAYKEYTKLRKQLKAIRSNASLSGTDKREKAEPIFKKQIKLAEWAEG